MKIISRLLFPDGASGSGKSNASATATESAASAAPENQSTAETATEVLEAAASLNAEDVVTRALAVAHKWEDEASSTTEAPAETEQPAEEETTPAEEAPKVEGEDGKPKVEKKDGETKETAPENIDAIKAENLQLKEQVSKLQRPIIQPTPESPLSHVDTPQDLEQAHREAQAIIEFCEENPDGATVKNAKGEEQELTAEDIRARKVSAMRIVNAVPKRQEFLTTRAQCDATAKEVYPQLFQPDTPEFTAINDILKTMPWLSQFPNASLIIGDALVGQAVRFAKMAEKSKGKDGKQVQTSAPKINPPVKPGEKATAAKPPVRPPTGNAPSRASAGTAQVDSARNNVKTGKASKADAEALIGTHLGLQ